MVDGFTLPGVGDSLSGPPQGSSLGLNTDLSSVADVSALESAVSNTVANGGSGFFPPWASNSVNSSLFHYITIDPSRWDGLYPYRLIVIDAFNNNTVVQPKNNGNQSDDVAVEVTAGTSSAIVSFTPFTNKWIFTLPISPTELSIVDQYAINVTPTLRGIAEEHSGVRFKMISAKGTMGVWPYRESLTSSPSSPSVLQSVFGGTISAFNNLVTQATNVVNTATTGLATSKPTSKRPENSTSGSGSTGYFQALALQQFLEQYAEAKRDPKNAGWRLVFDIPKQNQSFIVTPLPFTWHQSAQKPMEIDYTLQFKAWRRVFLEEVTSIVSDGITPISPGIMAKILNTVAQARNVTSSAISLIGAVQSDIEAPLNVLRQTTLFVKGVIGAAITAADLPFQLQQDYKSSIKDSINNLQTSITSSSSSPAVINAVNAVVASKTATEGLSFNAVGNGQIGTTAAQIQSIDPANNIFANPQANFELMDQVPVASLSLTPAQQNAVDQVVTQASQLTVSDFRSFRATIQSLANKISNNYGTNTQFYSNLFGGPALQTRLTPITLDEYDILTSLYDTMSSYDILTASNQIDDDQQQSNMDYVAGLAAEASIEFNTTAAKILVPVPLGLTVEQIALRYLGDAQRWLEIVTLNNLREPYIDEEGFTYDLLSNASGRQITIPSIADLYIGQRVILHSATQPMSVRQILSIDQLSDTSFLLGLDGLANLDNFTIADKAYLQAYLPGTVNSQQKIFIPSTLPVSDDPDITVPPVTATDPLTGLSKVDLLLDDNGDLAVNNFGDFRYSYGITNIIQALKIKIGTARNTILTHPEFGLGIRAGMSVSDVVNADIFKTINTLIQQDPRFIGLSTLQIQVANNTLTISMGVILAGQTGVFPVTFNLVS